ncbi:MAG: ATP synthase F1 subunit gamma [Tenuifilaceae bacterium]|nr:ATP synthase F1 subunit gamma [Tenuifilaceae bacterium]
MSGLKEIRNRINSITSTQKITSAMKMVSAAKFHKAQDTFFRFKPYSEKVSEVLSQVSAGNTSAEVIKWFGKPKLPRKAALVIISSNSSMCAGFNLNLVKKVIDEGPTIFGDLWKTNNLKVFCLGKKGADALTKRGVSIGLIDTELAHRAKFNEISSFCEENLLNRFETGDYDVVYVAYNVFRNPALQEPTIRQFLPYSFAGQNSSLKHAHKIIFEPNKEYINEVLIPMALKTSFYEMVLENAIGEHGARMTAMHQATENALELTKALKLQYNKARQAAITKEILEIVSGAEALKG